LAPELPFRKDVLKFSAPILIDVIDGRHAVGVVTFDHDAYPGVPVIQAGPPPDGIGRTTVRNEIDSYEPNPQGWTSIGDGLELSHKELDPITGYDLKATIILTDGHENREKYISEVADIINERVYAIGLGTPERIKPAALSALTNDTGGYMLVTGELEDDYFRLAKYYLQILSGVTNQQIILDPEGYLVPGHTHRIPFQLSNTDITVDIILLSPYPNLINFYLETPDGTLIDSNMASANPVVMHVLGKNVSYYRISLPIPVEAGETREGTWSAYLNIEGKYKRLMMSSTQSETSNPSSKGQVSAHGLRYCLSVHTYSNLKMDVYQSQESYEVGGTMLVRAVLTEYGLSVANRANVEVKIIRPDGTSATLNLPEMEPGIFETSILASMAGVYRFNVRSRGITLQGLPFTREQTRTGVVYRGGNKPAPTQRDDPRTWLREICRLWCIRIRILLLIVLCILVGLCILLLLR
ncbi:MAG: tyrosinase, partial [Candidatus Hodarchaeota archaeon]